MHWSVLYRRLEQADEPFVMISVVESRGSTPREIGARCFVTPGGRLEGTIGGGTLEEEARLEGATLLRRVTEAEAAGTPPPQAHTRNFTLGDLLGQCCGGRVRLLFEPVIPPQRLLIFGAGHVGRALARVLAESRLRVSVIDPRESFADPRRFPPEVEVTAGDPLALIPELVLDEARTHLVVMTHSHCLDQRILEQLLRRPFRFLGLIGSRAKWAKFRRELAEGGIPAATLDRVHCPVGLPLGDKRPAEVAVSIAAEILAQLPRASKGLEAKAARAAAVRGEGGRS